MGIHVWVTRCAQTVCRPFSRNIHSAPAVAKGENRTKTKKEKTNKNATRKRSNLRQWPSISDRFNLRGRCHGAVRRGPQYRCFPQLQLATVMPTAGEAHFWLLFGRWQRVTRRPGARPRIWEGDQTQKCKASGKASGKTAGLRPRTPPYFLAARQESRQRSAPHCPSPAPAGSRRVPCAAQMFRGPAKTRCAQTVCRSFSRNIHSAPAGTKGGNRSKKKEKNQ